METEKTIHIQGNLSFIDMINNEYIFYDWIAITDNY